MSSARDNRDSGLHEISSLLGLVGGGASTPKANSYVTIGMLQIVRKQLEESHAEEIANLRREFAMERGEREENEKRLKQCIEKLVEEVGKLGRHLNGEADKTSQNSNCAFLPNGEDEADLIGRGRVRSSPPSNYNNNVPTSNLNASTETITDVSRDEADSMEAETGVVFLHGKAVTAGRFLPFLCLCGLEFDSGSGLSKHVKKESGPELDVQSPKNNINTERLASTSAGSMEDRQDPQLENNLRGSSSTKCVKFPMKGLLRHGKDASHPRSCLCGREFRNHISLYHHIRRYTKEKSFSCRACGKAFAFASHLRAHSSKVHRRATTTKKKSTATTKLVNGKKVVVVNYRKTIEKTLEEAPANPDNSIPAPKPRKTSSTSRKNNKLKTGRNPSLLIKKAAPKFKRGIGGAFLFSKEHGLSKEVKDDDGNTRFVCKCGRSYCKMRVLRLHIRAVSAGGILKCTICAISKLFASLSGLKSHMKSEHKMDNYLKGKFACSTCTNAFGSLGEVNAHRLAAHRDEQI